MLDWLRRAVDTSGAVLFRGSLPPRPDDFDHLEKAGVTVSRAAERPDEHWALQLEHPAWGRAVMTAPRHHGPPPQVIVDLDPYLSDEERKLARLSGSSVRLRFVGTGENVLADRKRALRFLSAALGEHGLVAWDLTAFRFWSRAELADELAHEADLDIESLYVLHWVHQAGHRDAYWAHTHGLGAISFADFDILDANEDVCGRSADLVRALAFAVVEGALRLDGDPFHLTLSGVQVSLVSVARFEKALPPGAHSLWRAELDELHRERHGVVCEGRPGLLRRLLGGGRPVASRFLSRELPDDMPIAFSASATDLMSARARATAGVARALLEELADVGPQPLVKLGYEVDGGDGWEHLWFEVHAVGETDVDATLVNEPFRIASRHAGQRGRHSLDRLTDWVIFTPVGRVTPRSQRAARVLRERREEVLAALAKARQPAP